MARHRWATGEDTSIPDRPDGILAPAHPEHDRVQAGPQAGGEGAYAATASSGSLSGSDTARAGLAPLKARRPPRRWVATRRAALVAAGCALVVGGWQFMGTGHEPTSVVPVEGSAPTAPADASSTAATADAATAEAGTVTGGGGKGAGEQGSVSGGAGAETVVVHVAGAVQAPGVVETAAGSRVFEVLEQAGGALPEAELSAVNLAAVVQDGQQILIPRAGDTLQPVEAAPGQEPAVQEALVNLNTADASELEELPKVGPVLAARIVEWRTQHGSFARPEDLDAVPGIGPAMLESLVPLVTV